MPTLDSLSTLDDVINELMTTASWREQDSVPLAKRFVTAANIYLMTNAEQSSHGRSSLQLSHAYVERMRDDAQKFVNAKAGVNAGVKHLSLRGVRD